MKRVIIILFIFIHILTFAQQNEIIDNIDFNGYIQIKGTSNFDDYASFQVRRLKLWIKSKPEFSEHWSYKIQTTITSNQQEKFFLQDVKIGYKTRLFSFDIGQFIPQYSLQRFQADYKLPVIERAKVIDALIPNGTLGIRDIGLQANFRSNNKMIESHLGIFNGYGIKEYRFNNQGYMLSHKAVFNLPINDNEFKIGYSLQYRNAENLSIPKVLSDTVLFTGNDFRYNMFALYKNKMLACQAEFLNADFDGKHAYGYYLLLSINYHKNQLVLSYENYKDLMKETLDKPYYRIGYNYFINDYKIKLSLDNYFQIIGNKELNCITSIQLQKFLK